jgi:glycosyltransferase involved in cell wall biosynthesis
MLSIIIPTLNEEKYLPLLLLSLAKQQGEEDKSSSSPAEFPKEARARKRMKFSFDFAIARETKQQNFREEYEVIVADAGSKDKTIEIAKSFGCKVVKGGLPAKGRNEGAKVAKGHVFLFMDADNVFLPENFLNKLLTEFERKKLGVASFPTYPNGKTIDKIFYGIYNNFVNLTQIPYATNLVLVRKEIFEKVGGFDEEIKIGEDHYLAKQAAKFGKFGFIKTDSVLTSSRRLERDGRLRTYLKYILAGVYMFFFGPIKKPIFKYKFGHYSPSPRRGEGKEENKVLFALKKKKNKL